MKITYDEEADALYIQFQPKAEIQETVQIREGINCDINKDGKVYGIEILDVSRRLPLEELGNLSINIPIHAH